MKRKFLFASAACAILLGGTLSAQTHYVYFAGGGVISDTVANYDQALDAGTVVTSGGSAGSVQVGSVLVADVDVDAKTVTGWRRAGVLPGAPGEAYTYVEGGTAVYNGYLYVGGASFFEGTASGRVAYAPINPDGSLGTFAESDPIVATPGVRRLLNLAIVEVNGSPYIYAIGGSYNPGTGNISSTDRIEYAPINPDGSIGSWTPASATLPQTTWFHRNAVKDGVIYSSSGNTSGGVRAVNALTPNSGGDITLPALTSIYDAAAGERWDHGQVIATADGVDYLYLIGGTETSAATLNTVNYTALPLTGSSTWNTTNTLPGNRRRASAAAVEDMIIFPGGATATQMIFGTDTVYIGTVAPGGAVTWTTSPEPMFQPRSYGGVAIAPNPSATSIDNWNMFQ